MCRESFVAFVVLMLALRIPSFVQAGTATPSLPNFAQRGVISVDGNSELTITNGVVGGTGTSLDPYVIEGWEINASIGPGIWIRNTDAHIVIRGVFVHSGRDALPPPGHAGIHLTNVTNVRIERSISERNREGVLLNAVTNATVSVNRISENSLDGIWATGRNLTFADNMLLNNEGSGIYIVFSTQISVERNWADQNRGGGISALFSGVVVLTNNVASRNEASGISLLDSNDATIAVNLLHSNGLWGILLQRWTNARVEGNTASSNQYGIYVNSSFGILLSQNNFIGNPTQAFDDRGSENSWDDGYPTGGNHWADYSGLDNCSGPNQNVCPDPDGIGDAQVAIDADSVDRYPVMMQFNTPPTAEFSTDPISGTVATVFQVNGSLSRDYQDDPTALNVQWDWEDDGVWDTSWSTTKVASHGYSSPGFYSIRLQVRDTLGLTNTTTMSVLVQNTPPTAAFALNPSSGTILTPFNTNASSSFDLEDLSAALQVRWDWEDDGVWDTAWTTDKSSTHQYASPGTYTVRLEVQDSGGLTNQTAQGVVIVNTGPVASFTPVPLSGTIRTSFAFDASASSDMEDSGGQLEVRWDWEDDGVWDTSWSATKTATHQYPTPASYTIHLEVRDTGGLTNDTRRQVTVEDTPPTASFTVTPSSGPRATIFTFNASASSDLEDLSTELEVRWDWEDDGVWDTSWSATKTAEHRYASPGTYAIRVEVRDTGGFTNSTIRTVTVSAEQSGADYAPLAGVLIIAALVAVIVLYLLRRERRRPEE